MTIKLQASIFEELGPRLSTGIIPAKPQAAGDDAIQALLAFSALRQQVLTRRAGAGAAVLPRGSADEFVLDQVLQLVTERALALTGADGVAIALVQEGEIICRATTGTIAPEIGARLDPQSGLSGMCFVSGETAFCNDAERDPRVNVAASRDLHARSIVAVPLRGRRSVVGLLEAFSTDAFAFSESDVRSLNLLAELILAAMKPEEEEKFEGLSPAPVLLATGTPVQQSAKVSPQAAATESPKAGAAPANDFVEIEPEHSTGPAAEIPLALLRDYEKNSVARPGAMLLSALVLVVLASLTVLSWRAESAPDSASAAVSLASSQPQLSEPIPPPHTIPVPVVADLPQPSAIPADARQNVLPLLTGVRHWVAGDSTMVAIDLQDQVQYEVHRLSSPERIYFDLHDTVLAPGLNGTSIDVVNDLLSRIRVAQAAAGVARVVLDTRNGSNFTVGLEPNPYRLIIEIRRGRSEQPPKTNIDLIRSSRSSPRGKLTFSPPPLSKEDRLLRWRVPHLRIVVDAGHGGWDLGTVGRQGVVEKDLVLDISRRLGKLLESRLGSEILYTRSEDAFVPLEERAEIANDAQADLFVSIHANNSDYPSARGVETYYTNVFAPANSLEIEKRDNAITRATVPSVVFSQVGLKERTEHSRDLAASVEHALYGSLSTKNPAIRDRGVKEAGFLVLTDTTITAVLAEISFVSSPADERNLQSSPYRKQIAEALYKGITHYAAASSHMKLARVR